MTTIEQSIGWFRGLPPRTTAWVREQALQQARDEERVRPEDGISSSDMHWLVNAYVSAYGTKEADSMADLERSLIETNFDFEAGARLFAPAGGADQ